ncbi:uncharacterized protein LOC110032172 isoform X2 [Phalaenopsis equestris]|uniref:uncharacterized protein LOC110032172 isoform X2 n=1 Tax=Phalaenopsis equestris TaxID=78828 RepID=UPI0009E29848|nr:uncharacterized protein LOC110032172 isoform X2 [Phalaenopsis equestris]
MHLCFLLDLRNISSPLLKDLKQLADLFAAGSVGGERVLRREEMMLLPDRIGLCYIQRNESSSSSSELKIAYRPGGNFNLRDFHQAVNNLPKCFQTESSPFMSTKCDNEVELSIRKLLSDEFLYMWNGKDIQKKVIVTASSVDIFSEALQNISMDAVTKQVPIEFVVLEQEAILNSGSSLNLSKFNDFFEQHQNCFIHRHCADTWILSGLVKMWLQDLRDDVDGMNAVLAFKHAIWESSNQISCRLFASTSMIVDGFTSCVTCRCHGCPISDAYKQAKKNVCPVTSLELGESDLIENAISVGGNTLLFVPSFESSSELHKISGLITLNVIERTSLASLNEGVIMGTSYIIAPVYHDKKAASKEHEMNARIFHGLCESLYSLDQGLVCSSSCNLENMTYGSFMSFYILQPSYHGLMLLRRLAASEEIFPYSSRTKQIFASEEIKNFIKASLSKVELRDYNPLEHERGLYPQLGRLVDESLQFGSLPKHESSHKLADIQHHQSSSSQKPSVLIISEEENEGYSNTNQDENASSSITDEWEQLVIVDDMNDSLSAATISLPKTHVSVLTHDRPLDERTSRILERLEAPKCSPSFSTKVISKENKNSIVKLDPISIQPLRPNFQRPKRKLG